MWVHSDWVRQVMDWLSGMSFPNGEGDVKFNATGILFALSNGVYAVQLTGDKDSGGYYHGSVFADGISQGATHSDQLIDMPFDIDITDDQGYYYAIRQNTEIELSASTVWHVVGGIPRAPADKIAYLRSSYGVLSWIERGTC